MIGRPSILAAPSNRRRQRHPSHAFNVRMAPYVIQPFMIAPVLPGETLQGLSFETRALTNPIKSSLIGWWLEHYFFYVRLSDIDARNEQTLFRELLINDAAITGHEDWKNAAAADTWAYWSSGLTGMDYVTACAKVVIENYFRDQGGAWNQVTIDGEPAAYLVGNTAWDSALLETSMDAATDVTIETTETEGVPNVVEVSTRDVVEALRQYEVMYEQGLVDMTWEDYLRSYGVSAPRAQEHVPELIRYSKDWQYPSSHVAPDTVTAGDSDVTTAVSWVVRERADRKRFFREPGFIFGMSCARPKVYMSVQRLPMVSLLTDSKDWLPMVTMGAREGGWKKITDAATDILVGAASGDFWVDLRDLFLYGDQYVASNATGIGSLTDINTMTSPPAAPENWRHPVQASVDAMFVSGDATDGVKQDGIVRMHISSRIPGDLSPRGMTPRLVT